MNVRLQAIQQLYKTLFPNARAIENYAFLAVKLRVCAITNPNSYIKSGITFRNIKKGFRVSGRVLVEYLYNYPGIRYSFIFINNLMSLFRRLVVMHEHLFEFTFINN